MPQSAAAVFEHVALGLCQHLHPPQLTTIHPYVHCWTQRINTYLPLLRTLIRSMDQACYSPHPSMDSASDYTPERVVHTTTTKRRPRGSMTAEERREARAHRNRLAAQSSRDRKKAQFEQLATRLAELEEENRSLRLGLARPTSASSSSSSLEAGLLQENQDLRARVQQLELAWQNMTKILATMAIPVPLPSSSSAALPAMATTTRPTTNTPISNDPKLPLSPAPTSSSSSDSLDAITSEPTCELARFANVSVEASLQRVAPSARSLVIRLLAEQQTNWGPPRCLTTTTTPSPLVTNGPSVACF
ncbi:1922_t:CDS:1 [Acaulospora colombiana]|uniref:1922_t:CDS:1 n=1 Tax=Acaulospora colombiana TaxID=27376 RepID=A0ACA9MRI7_9GLOM|nr:1922_t:CDS:1 [Acaulospora colombiana]